MKMLATLRRSAEKRAAFRRTVRELRSLPAGVARDLQIDRDNVRGIARQAVYGA
ncbi:hypothetical protein [Tropicimonas sp. IMCC6043]|uniref:hypothetical protein n=1 Tax=Tropicimonas sp. IMCC6043 TaxID=2510645 RepID=UPI0013EDEEBC|nr:hypothetical protein [Tropicimonas sp. IMCC6043]